ncbi:MAG: hypothetical protein U1A23_04780 [Candidatus Sungbacteria bacterium]|nr:hypothetical protein [bacterium]MDZ4286219.1 hypothetical protein [Candidatus Sungbacteria bacterium]
MENKNNKEEGELRIWSAPEKEPEVTILRPVNPDIADMPKMGTECPEHHYVGIGRVSLAGRGITQEDARADLYNKMGHLCDINSNTPKCVGACTSNRCCRTFILAAVMECHRSLAPIWRVPIYGITNIFRRIIGRIPIPFYGYVCTYTGLLSCGCECLEHCIVRPDPCITPPCPPVPCKNPPCCKVAVKAITFNHDTSSLTHDALTIRKNFTTNVNIPEWVEGETLSEQSPAAYAIKETTGNTITIKAKFIIAPPMVTQAEIKADGGGVLGALDPQVVNFAGGISVPEFVPFPLNHHQIGVNGILREDIAWKWKYRCIGEAEWHDMATTNHRIYIILEEPKASWDQIFGTTNNPWTDVLDYSCVWANGKKTRDDAAGVITGVIYNNLGLIYDMNQGASRYTTPANGLNFECTKFIQYLQGAGGLGNIVNCTDNATITTTFSNVLGCDLHASRMGWNFDLNQIIAIGQGGWGCPNWGCGFSYHEVAWKGNGGAADNIFDSCLQVDSDGNPWAIPAPHTSLLPVNIPFTTIPNPVCPLTIPFNAMSYRERLSTNDNSGFCNHHCDPQGPWGGSNGGRRKVI